MKCGHQIETNLSRKHCRRTCYCIHHKIITCRYSMTNQIFKNKKQQYHQSTRTDCAPIFNEGFVEFGDERVYVVADAAGTVESVTDSIRLENAYHLDEIKDRTMLTGIINVSGKESFSLDGETLVWQAGGKDICYQGTSGKQPAAVPVARLTLDGEEITAEEMKGRAGEAELTVSYTGSGDLPILAVTVIPLPEEGVDNLQLTNAAVLSEMGRRVLVGWAVPGADAALKLPASFSAKFTADHADLGWMMTLATAEPLDMLARELDGRLDAGVQQEIRDAALLLAAMKNGEELPPVSGKTREAADKLRMLNNGLAQLDDSAGQIAGGAQEVSGGAASLNTALSSLKENNEALNSGAEKIMNATLAEANSRIAASGLEAAGIKLPKLTAENYAAVIDKAISALDGRRRRRTAWPRSGNSWTG